MSDRPGTVLWPVEGREPIRVTSEDAIALTNDRVLRGNAFVRPSPDDPELYERIPPEEVSE